MMKGTLGRRVSCEWVAMHLDAYLDGELDARGAKKLRAHLDECPTCRALAKETEELLSLAAACDDVTPDPSVHENIMRALGDQPRARVSPARRPMWQRLGAPLIGACLLLALILIPPTMRNPSAPSHDPMDEAPGMDDGSDNKPSSPDDEAADEPSSDRPEYDAPGCDSPGKEEPTQPAPPGSEESGDSDAGIGAEDDGAKIVYVLYRQTPASELEDIGSLWQYLEGEWMGENVSLIVSAEDHMVQFSDETQDIWASAVLVENRLILNPDTDEMINFWVRLDGDTLWLTRIP